MEFKTIISAETLQAQLSNPAWVIVDCRFYLQEPERGYQEYLESHLPGAIYLNLDTDLSGEIIPGKTGRHPLPDPQVFADRLSGWGIENSTQVIVYDNKGGALASRLWWMANLCNRVESLTLNEALTAFLYQTDVRANIIERPTTSQSIPVFSSIVRILYKSFQGDKRLFKRKIFRPFICGLRNL